MCQCQGSWSVFQILQSREETKIHKAFGAALHVLSCFWQFSFCSFFWCESKKTIGGSSCFIDPVIQRSTAKNGCISPYTWSSRAKSRISLPRKIWCLHFLHVHRASHLKSYPPTLPGSSQGRAAPGTTFGVEPFRGLATSPGIAPMHCNLRTCLSRGLGQSSETAAWPRPPQNLCTLPCARGFAAC